HKKKQKDSKIYDIPTYAQSEEFTSAAACAMMLLKYSKKNFKMSKENEFAIWEEAVRGSVWHGSRYGIAYALAKRGITPQIITTAKDEGYEKKLAVLEGINLDALKASFAEIRDKAKGMSIKESYGLATINTIKKQLAANMIPIVVVNANAINPYLESSPHWVVVKGYDKEFFYINDPYSDSTITMEPEQFKAALGYEGEHHMIVVKAPSKR
ncbi:MAG: peptidase C39 family protein, partial [Candidatus Micrarchaeaceae archaeon]